VAKTRGVDDFAKIGRVHAQLAEAVTRTNVRAGPRTERASHRPHLEGMREPGAGEIVFREREDLRFVLQSAKCAGENDAVAVALEIGATRLAMSRFGSSQLVSAKKLGPIHAARLPEGSAGKKRENREAENWLRRIGSAGSYAFATRSYLIPTIRCPSKRFTDLGKRNSRACLSFVL
jgi:hypothetical protein